MQQATPGPIPDRAACARLDAEHPLGRLRERFRMPKDTIYLCGNSMGPVGVDVPDGMRRAVEVEWTESVVRAWSSAGWHVAPSRVGALLSRLIGAEENEVIVVDSTSVNLFKLLVGAMRLNPGRRVIVAERGDFPTDPYIAASVAEMMGGEVRLVDPQDLAAAIDSTVAVVAVSEVNYRTCHRHDMAAMTRRAHDAGALMLWDLSHSAGTMQIALNAANADLAVGCGYKYLNGGPGAPAYAFVARRHQHRRRQPPPGWHGHAAPFAFAETYEPGEGILRLRCGTSPQLSLIALEAALAAFEGVDLKVLRNRSEQLSATFVALYDAHLASRGFSLLTPRDPARRGAHISLVHPQGYAIMQALLARRVVGDLRAPDVLRFGLAPLYVRCVDVHDTVQALMEIVDQRIHEHAEFRQPGRVL